MRFFITSKKGSKYTDSPSVESLVPEVKWLNKWESFTNKDTRIGEISDEMYDEVTAKLSVHFDVFKDFQFTICS